ncbi:MAG TPA: hypothetical protein PLF81_00805 [Candidatus Anammoximicrobium sp.]|nr:hypothetical protein [Candidatus Anammoximicrobium sp.]
MVEQIGNYRFRYCNDVDRPGKVRIYIEQQPSYNGKPTDSHSTHRLSSGSGAPPHICIKSECQPSTLAQAQAKAREWIGYTERYRRS